MTPLLRSDCDRSKRIRPNNWAFGLKGPKIGSNFSLNLVGMLDDSFEFAVKGFTTMITAHPGAGANAFGADKYTTEQTLL